MAGKYDFLRIQAELEEKLLHQNQNKLAVFKELMFDLGFNLYNPDTEAMEIMELFETLFTSEAFD